MAWKILSRIVHQPTESREVLVSVVLVEELEWRLAILWRDWGTLDCMHEDKAGFLPVRGGGVNHPSRKVYYKLDLTHLAPLRILGFRFRLINLILKKWV